MLFSTSKFFLYASVFTVAIVTLSTLFPFIVGKYAFFRIAVDLALIFFLLGLLLDEKGREYEARLKKVVISPLGIAVGLFVAAFLLAGFFGVDPSFSFWSNFERGEGGIQLLHLYVFFVLLVTLFRDERAWKKFFFCSLIAASLMILYGLGAGAKFFDAELLPKEGAGITDFTPSGKGGPWYHTFEKFVGPSFAEPNYRFQGSIGNPAYVAAYLLFSLFYSLYLLAGTKRKTPYRLVGYFLWAIFLGAFFFLAATRGAFLGLVAAGFMFLIYLGFTRREWRKWIIGAGALVILSVGLLIGFKNSAFVKAIPGSRVFQISFSEKTLGDRAIMWKTAWEGWKARPIFGWGPENYINVFDKHFQIEYFKPNEGIGAWFDRAHSVIFDYLVETGIVGLFAYLGIFASLYYSIYLRRLKTSPPRPSASNNFQWALIPAIIAAYLVQGLVLFDVLIIYLNLFAVLAFATYKLNFETVVNIPHSSR